MKYLLKYWWVILILLAGVAVALLFGKLSVFISTLMGTGALVAIKNKRNLIDLIDKKAEADIEELKNQTYDNTDLDDDPIIRRAQRRRAKDRKNNS